MPVVGRKAGKGRARSVLVEELEPVQAVIDQPANEIFRHLTRPRHARQQA